MKFIPLVALLVLLTSCSINFSAAGQVDVDPKYQHKVDLMPAGADDLIVMWDSGSVDLIADDSKNVRVLAVGYRNGNLVTPDVWLEHASFKVEDGAVRLIFDYGKTSERESTVVEFLTNPFSIALQIHFPRSMVVNVDTSNGSIDLAGGASAALDTSNGSIEVDGVHGDLHLDTSNGSIEVNGSLGEVYADTSNGSIKLNGSPGEVYADTSNGWINLDISGDHIGAITADSSNGKITVTMSGYQHDPVVLSTSNGAIELHAGPGFAADTELDTSNGAIEVFLSDLPAGLAIDATASSGKASTNLPGVSVYNEYGSGSIERDGDGPTITADTSNGSVSITATKIE